MADPTDHTDGAPAPRPGEDAPGSGPGQHRMPSMEEADARNGEPDALRSGDRDRDREQRAPTDHA